VSEGVVAAAYGGRGGGGGGGEDFFIAKIQIFKHSAGASRREPSGLSRLFSSWWQRSKRAQPAVETENLPLPGGRSSPLTSGGSWQGS